MRHPACLILASLILAVVCRDSIAGPLPRVRIEGNRLVAGGQTIRLRGTNLGNWLLLEDFMIGLHGNHSRMRAAMTRAIGAGPAAAFWDEYESVYFTDRDATYLAGLGFNLLRVPLNQNRFEDQNNPGVYDPVALARLDEVIRLCASHGIYVMIDLHAVPGGQSRQIYADSAWARAEFWEYADFRRRAADFWAFLARRYRDDDAVAGYDLLNEPNTEGRTALLTGWYRDVLRRVRAEDVSHIVWLESDDWGKHFQGLEPDLLADPQVTVQFHAYPSFTFPIARLTQYPQTVDGVRYDHAWLRTLWARHIAFARTKPLILGEFGFSTREAKVDMMEAMAEDFVVLCDEEGWSWSQWTYKDQGHMSIVSPVASTPWLRFLRSPSLAPVKDKAHELFPLRYREDPSSDLLAVYTRALGTGLDGAVASQTALSARRVFESLLSERVLLALKGVDETGARELARSFAFEQCAPNEPLIRLVHSAAAGR
jgi:endoglucanase